MPAFLEIQILRTGLQSIPDLIELDLTRTAFSPLVYEYKDYAVGVVDADGKPLSPADFAARFGAELKLDTSPQ